jgi:UTP:GlnB (protein PII) uridylyltransferase
MPSEKEISSPWRSGEIIEVKGPSPYFQLVLRGEDRPGLLVETCEIFLKLQVEVLFARIQTWGKLAEDVFVLRLPGLQQNESLTHWWQQARFMLLKNAN